MPRSAGFYRTRTAAGVEVVFVEYPPFYDRARRSTATTRDNRLRFAFLARAALEYFRSRGERPSVFHAHDWQTGLVPVYLKAFYWDDPTLHRIAERLHDPQRRLPGPVRDGHARPPGPALEPRHAPTRSSTTAAISYLKGGTVFAELRQHRLPDLRPRDPGPGARLRLRRRRALARARPGRDPERRRLRRVGPARRPAHRAARTRPRTSSGKAACKADLLRSLRAARVPGPAARRRHVAARVAEGLRHRGRRLVGLPAAAAAHGGAGHGGATACRTACAHLQQRDPDRFAVRFGYDEAARPQDHGRLRHVPDALALRALRPHADVRAALRHGPDRALDRRARRTRSSPSTPRRGTGTGFRFDTPDGTGLLWALDQALAACKDARGLEGADAAGDGARLLVGALGAGLRRSLPARDRARLGSRATNRRGSR